MKDQFQRDRLCMGLPVISDDSFNQLILPWEITQNYCFERSASEFHFTNGIDHLVGIPAIEECHEKLIGICSPTFVRRLLYEPYLDSCAAPDLGLEQMEICHRAATEP